MISVTSAEKCRALIRENSARHGTCNSNCLLIGGKILDAIPKGRLFYRTFSHGLVLYRDEGNYYEASYFWKKNQPLDDLRADKDISVIEISTNNRQDAYPAQLKPNLEAAGFERFRRTLQFELNVPEAWKTLEPAYIEQLARAEANGFILRDPVPPELRKAVADLWESRLDAMTVSLSQKECLIAGTSGHAVCLTAPDGTVSSSYWWQTARTSAEGWHIVTHPSFAQQGLAILLLMHAVKKLNDNGIRRLITYIGDDNFKSINLHREIGFTGNGRTAVQFILRKRTPSQ